MFIRQKLWRLWWPLMHGMLLKHKYADNVKAIVFFFSVEYTLSFGFSVGFEGKIKMTPTLNIFGVVSRFLCSGGWQVCLWLNETFESYTDRGYWSRNFRQFQLWSNSHRINWNIKITPQNCRRTLTKHKPSQEGTRMDKTGEDYNGLHLGKFEKRRLTFFKLRYS